MADINKLEEELNSLTKKRDSLDKKLPSVQENVEKRKENKNDRIDIKKAQGAGDATQSGKKKEAAVKRIEGQIERIDQKPKKINREIERLDKKIKSLSEQIEAEKKAKAEQDAIDLKNKTADIGKKAEALQKPQNREAVDLAEQMRKNSVNGNPDVPVEKGGTKETPRVFADFEKEVGKIDINNASISELEDALKKAQEWKSKNYKPGESSDLMDAYQKSLADKIYNKKEDAKVYRKKLESDPGTANIKKANSWNRAMFGNDYGSTNGGTSFVAEKNYKTEKQRLDDLRGKAEGFEKTFLVLSPEGKVPSDEDLQIANDRLANATTEEEKAEAQKEIDRLNAIIEAKKALDGAIDAANAQISVVAEAEKKLSDKENNSIVAKEDKKKKAEEFLKNNPNLIKAIFGDSGNNFGERLGALAELIATVGTNAARGYVTKGQSELVTGKLQNIYDEAVKKANERKQAKFDEEAKQEAKISTVTSILDSDPTTSNWEAGIKNKLSRKIASGRDMSQTEFFDFLEENTKGMTEDELKKYGLVKVKNQDGGVTIVQGSNFEDVYKSYQDSYRQSELRKENKKSELEIESMSDNVMFNCWDKIISTQSRCQEMVNAINKAINDLESQKDKLRTASKDDFFNYLKNYKDWLSGVQTSTANMGKSSEGHWDLSQKVSASGNIYMVKAQADTSISGGGSNSFNEASSVAEDKLIKDRMPGIEAAAKDWENNNSKAREEFMAEIDNQIAELKAQKEKWTRQLSNLPDVNDGIIKATGEEQWIQRASGEKIKLNPYDNLYATVKKITSPSDKGQKVVPMDEDEQVKVVMDKLGYDGKLINRNFDYYRNKLRGF